MSCHEPYLLNPDLRMPPLKEQIAYLGAVREICGLSIRHQATSFHGKISEKSALGKFIDGRFKKMKPYQVRLLYNCFSRHFYDRDTDTMSPRKDIDLCYFDFCYLEDNIVKKLNLCKRHIESMTRYNNGLRRFDNLWICAFEDRFIFYGYFARLDLPGRSVAYDLREITDLNRNRKPCRGNRFGGTPDSHIKNIMKLWKYCKRAGIRIFRVERELARQLGIVEYLPELGFKLEQHLDFDHENKMWTKTRN